MPVALHHWGGRLWSLALTISAVLGALCLVATIAAPVLGIRPLIFTSGSMAPAIPAGSLALAREVSAEDLRVGDVVTVPVHGSYVTHRIVSVTHGNSTATLVLRGDGNKVSDADAYAVSSVPRTFFSVPHLGTFIAWFSRTPGVYVLALWVAVVLGSLRRGERAPRRSPQPVTVPPWHRLKPGVATRPRRRGLVPVHAFVGVVLAAPWLAPTATLASDVPPEPVAPVAPVTTSPTTTTVPLLWCHRPDRGRVTVSWTPVAGATSYRLLLGSKSTNVPSGVTSKTFGGRAQGTVAVKAISATGLWISERSNGVRYQSAGRGSCR